MFFKKVDLQDILKNLRKVLRVKKQISISFSNDVLMKNASIDVASEYQQQLIRTTKHQTKFTNKVFGIKIIVLIEIGREKKPRVIFMSTVEIFRETNLYVNLMKV